MSQSSYGPFGYQEGNSDGSARNGLGFLIESIVGQHATVTLGKVVAVTNAGGIAPVGSVDIQPLVNQIDGVGNATPHGVIHNLPYMRLQGGANAIILDPVVGDIGIVLFASHDISSVKASKAQANPGSRRRFDMADGLFIGGCLNGTPSQYVAFTPTGIEIVSLTGIAMNAPSIAFTSTTLTHNGVNIGSTHVHSGVQSGGSNSGVPH